MANITTAELREEIAAELKDADLSNVSAKKVRQAIEKRLDEDLTDRKKEIDEIIMDIIDEKDEDQNGDAAGNGAKGDGEDDEDKSESEEEEEEKKKTRKPKKKRTRDASDDGDSDVDESYSPKKRSAPKARASRKAADSDADEDDAKPAKKAKGKAKKGGGATGYTKQCKLSPELSKLMGEERMARHEVIKKMWAIIKENNMYDPKNKQFAICDDAMKEVIGVKRFRTFGMMKYLKTHFLQD